MDTTDNARCYTINLTESEFTQHTENSLRRYISNNWVTLYKLQNGQKRILICVNDDTYIDRVKEKGLVLEKEIAMDILKDIVTRIDLSYLKEEFQERSDE